MKRIVVGKKDIVWSYIGNFFKIATNILLLPFILKFLNDDELGMWYVFASIGQIVILLDFGFAPSLARNIAYVWCGATNLKKESVENIENARTDFSVLKVVLGTCRYFYLLIASCALILLLTFGSMYIDSLEIKSSTVMIAWIIYAVSIFLNLFYSYYTSSLCGIGAIAENNIASVFSKVTQLVVSLILLKCNLGLIAVAVGYLASGLVLRIVSRILFVRYEGIGRVLKDVRVDHPFRKYYEMFRIISFNASKDGLVTIASYLSTQANTLICSSVLSLTSTGSYSLSVQLATFVSSIAAILYTAFQPSLQEKAARHDMIGGRKLMSIAFVFYIVSYGVLAIGVILLSPAIRIFKPNFEISNIMLLILLLYMFLYKSYQLFCSYISNMNTLPYVRAYLITAVFSTILSFLTAKYTGLGIWSLIISPLVVNLVYNIWKWPFVALKMMNDTPMSFLQRGMKIVGYIIRYRKVPIE